MNVVHSIRFKFTLYNDCEFNYEIVVDIIYLNGNRSTLYIVDTATVFNVAQFLKDITLRSV